MLRMLLALCLALSAQTAAAATYGAADFARLDKIDAHVHLSGPADALVAQAERDGFRLLTINVDYPDFPPIDSQQRDAAALHARHPSRIAFAATFSVQRFGSPDWASGEIKRLEGAFAQGAVGVKVWKNIGLELRDAAGTYVMLDDARLAPIFDRLERDNVVLLGHQAEPLNCWLPFDKMTVRSDRDYFREHPRYYMYLHPEVPSHEAQLAARDRMLAAHPKLRFDAVHLASQEWDVHRIAAFLERFPQASVDVAARMSHLEYQGTRHRDQVRAFFLKYQDRILYGTDIALLPTDDAAAVAAEAHRAWREDWRFLTASSLMRSSEFSRPFRGLALPRSVVDKVYAQNARRLFPAAWPQG